MATKAPIAPAGVEFQIHQVVNTFQISMDNSENRKKRFVFFSSFAMKNNGTQAMNIRGEYRKSGHAKTSKSPLRILSNKEDCFFKIIDLPIWKV